MPTIFRFSYRNSRLNCWICSKIFTVNFELIDNIDQKISVDFEQLQNNQKNLKSLFQIIKCVIPLIIHVIRIRRNILFFKSQYIFSKRSNHFYSSPVLTFYDLSFLPFCRWFQPPLSRFYILLIKFYLVSTSLFFLIFWLSSPLLHTFEWNF